LQEFWSGTVQLQNRAMANLGIDSRQSETVSAPALLSQPLPQEE
jgi:hypothetical protein